MNAENTDRVTRNGERERFAIVVIALCCAGLITWAVLENYLIQIAYIGGAFAFALLTVFLVAAFKQGLRWFASRGALRFYFWVIVSVISLVVLFYAEEKWRGQRAWVALQKEAAARGESLELESIIPPDVPDDQNFAKAPGVHDLLLFPVPPERRVPESSPFYHGAHDAWPRGDWRVGKFTPLAEWDAFLSGETNVHPDSAEPLREINRELAGKAVLKHLDRFATNLSLLATAAERPAVRLPIDYNQGWEAQSGSYRVVTSLYHAAHALSLRASAGLAAGRVDEALNDSLLVFYLAQVLRKEPYIWGQHLRSQMIVFALQPIWEGLAAHAWQERHLQTLSEAMAEIDITADALRGPRGETILLLDMASQLQAYLEGKRSRFAEDLAAQKGGDAFAVWLFRTIYPKGWLAQDRVWIYRFYERHAQPALVRGWVELGDQNWKRELVSATDPLVPVMIAPRMRMVCDSVEWAMYLEASLNQARVACALERYRLSEGFYPETLDQLVGRFLDQLPRDRFAPEEKTFNYSTIGKADFTLYSFGLNRRDDGGKPFPGEHSFYSDLDKNDWVWSYPAPKEAR